MDSSTFYEELLKRIDILVNTANNAATEAAAVAANQKDSLEDQEAIYKEKIARRTLAEANLMEAQMKLQEVKQRAQQNAAIAANLANQQGL